MHVWFIIFDLNSNLHEQMINAGQKTRKKDDKKLIKFREYVAQKAKVHGANVARLEAEREILLDKRDLILKQLRDKKLKRQPTPMSGGCVLYHIYAYIF